MEISHILFIGHLWPEPDSSAAGYRTMALIDSCIENNWKVSFACAAEETQWSFKLQTLGINCYPIKINSDSFDSQICSINPDFVVFDRFITEEQFSWRVEKQCPDAIRVLDTCDLHFLRRARHLQIKNNDKTPNLHTEDSLREISSLYRCDLSLIISSYEMQLLTDEFNIDKNILMYLPFMFETKGLKEKIRRGASFTQRKNFFMIGNFLHQPNWDAVLWCSQKLWPKIRTEIPDAQCHIYGAYTPDKAMQLHQPKQGFYIKGRAENLDILLNNYRVNLVPLRFGAGIKGKIADGFVNGLPCITTPVGAEGMAEDLSWGGFICENESDFITSAITLYKNCDVWQQKQQAAYEIIDKIHNKTLHQKKFIEKLLDLKQNIISNRNKNFIGAMLRYHLNRSHKFMSRWIEEKNK